MKNFKIFIFQIGNIRVIKKLPIYEILKIWRTHYLKKGTLASHIQNSLQIYFLYIYTFPI